MFCDISGLDFNFFRQKRALESDFKVTIKYMSLDLDYAIRMWNWIQIHQNSLEFLHRYVS